MTVIQLIMLIAYISCWIYVIYEAWIWWRNSWSIISNLDGILFCNSIFTTIFLIVNISLLIVTCIIQLFKQDYTWLYNILTHKII